MSIKSKYLQTVNKPERQAESLPIFQPKATPSVRVKGKKAVEHKSKANTQKR